MVLLSVGASARKSMLPFPSGVRTATATVPFAAPAVRSHRDDVVVPDPVAVHVDEHVELVHGGVRPPPVRGNREGEEVVGGERLDAGGA